MSSVIAHSISKTIFYIDPSLAVDGSNNASGDGSSLANASPSFPATLSANHLYLIRRCAETNTVTGGSGTDVLNQCAKIPANSANSASDIMIMGMPKSTDKEYAYLQSIMSSADFEALVSAWGGDNEDYANVSVEVTSTSSVAPVVFNACNNFSMSRVKYLLKYKSNSNFYNNNPTFKAGIAFSSSSIATSFTFSHCVFKMMDYDLINASNPFSYSGTSQNDYQNGYKFPFAFIYANYSNSSGVMADHFNILDCQIQKNGVGRSFYIKNVNTFIAKNLDVYVSQGGSTNGEHAVFYIENVSSGSINFVSTKAIIDNINIYQSFVKYADADGYGYYRALITTFYFNRLRDIICTNVTAVKNSHNNMTPNNDIVYTRPIIDATIINGTGKFEDITINYPFCRALSESLLKVINSPLANNNNSDGKVTMYHPQNRQFITLKNISITTASVTNNVLDGYADNNSSTAPSPYHTTSEYDMGEGNSEYANPNKGALFLQFIENNYKNTHHPVNDGFILTNITLDCKAGAALYADNAMIDLNAKTIIGGVSLRNCVGKINKITTWYPGRVLYDRGDNLLYIGEIECNKTNPVYEYSPTPSIVPSWGSHILVGQTNSKFMPNDFDTSASGICNYICRSELVTGNYTVRNQIMKAQTWSVNRTGGSSCTVKLENTNLDKPSRPILIGGEPFGGIQCNVTANTTSLTIYATTYGYSTPSDIYKHLKIKVTLPNGTILTSDDGNWQEDLTSTWNEISNGTAFKFVLPIKSGLITANGIATVEYAFDWYKTDAATFLDPFPVAAS